jgi:hypothetical protein
MTESVSIFENDTRVIQALSEKLKVPQCQVIEVYRTEFNRLAARSRIETFVGVLGACLSNPREPRWLGEGADARRAAPAVAGTTDQPRNAADAPAS